MSALPNLDTLNVERLREPYDTIAKEMPRLLPSMSVQLCPYIAAVRGPLPTELIEETRSKYADLVLEAQLRQPLESPLPGEPPVSTAWFLIEGTDEIRPEKLPQVLDYWGLLRKSNKYRIPVIPCMLVVKDIPAGDRERTLAAGWDLDLCPMALRVGYIDEIDVTLLSPRDQVHPAAKMCAIMPVRENPRESIRTAYMAVLGWHEKAIVFDLLVLLVCVCIRCRCLPVLKEVMTEVRMADLSWMSEQEQREWSAAVNHTVAHMPGFEEMMNEEFVMPAKQQGLEQGLEQGREQGQRLKHVADLLDVLSWQSIQLSEQQLEALHQMPLERLPALDVARDSSSAADFAQRAGLLNGYDGGNGHG